VTLAMSLLAKRAPAPLLVSATDSSGTVTPPQLYR
jgi:hypothetical protein